MVFKKRGAQNIVEIGLLIAVVTVASIYFYTSLGAQSSKLTKMSTVTTRQPALNHTEEVAGVSAAKGFSAETSGQVSTNINNKSQNQINFSPNTSGSSQSQSNSSSGHSSSGVQSKIETTGVNANMAPSGASNIKVGK